MRVLMHRYPHLEIACDFEYGKDVQEKVKLRSTVRRNEDVMRLTIFCVFVGVCSEVFDKRKGRIGWRKELRLLGLSVFEYSDPICTQGLDLYTHSLKALPTPFSNQQQPK